MSQQREHGITWADATWNPIRGCSRVSQGCVNCYAERTAAFRHSGGGRPYEGIAIVKNGKPHWTGQVRVVEERMLDPLRWRRPRRIFVNSMSDLFHENVADETIDRIFAVMALAPQHTFQVLTKRPARMLEWFTKERDEVPGAMKSWRSSAWCAWSQASAINSTYGMGAWPCMSWRGDQIAGWPLKNVWLGVSVEHQAAADERIPVLLQTPAEVRWISAEPLLGDLDLKNLSLGGMEFGYSFVDALFGWYSDRANKCGPGQKSARLDWVVVGGESGPGARPMHPDWARSLRDQCVAAGVAFHFKQWGEWAYVMPAPNDDEWASGDALVNAYQGDIRGSESLTDESTALMRRVGKRAAGRLLDGREWNEYPRERANDGR